MKKIFKNGIVYIKYYGKKDRITNRVLVIGFLRKYFKFKFFLYIYLRKSK